MFFLDFTNLLVSVSVYQGIYSIILALLMQMHDPHMPFIQVDEGGTTSTCLLEERRFLWGMYEVMILVG